MLVGVGYDEASRQLTVRGASGNLRVVVERLHATAELHPDRWLCTSAVAAATLLDGSRTCRSGANDFLSDAAEVT